MELVIRCSQLLTHAKEVLETVNVRDALTRLHEVKILHREVEFLFDRVENQLALAFKKQTGTRAICNLWQNLARNIDPGDGKT